MIIFSEIEDAFLFVSSDQQFMHFAVINRNTGEIYYKSDLAGIDEFPEDVESEDYIDIPHKNDLNLGRNLVFDFVSRLFPQKTEEIERIFRRRGAYGNYKSLLDSIGLLEKWYEFENQQTKDALLQWCKENGLELKEIT